jgi:hypothetical protein
MKKNTSKEDSAKYDALGFHVFVGAVIVFVVGVLIAGLWLGGSPSQERTRRLDAARVSDLQNIANAIDQYFNTQDTLPSDLEMLTLSRETYFVGSITDPESGAPYEYVVRGTDTYDLCASFTTDNREEAGVVPREPYPTWESRFWEHGPEHTCFAITARTFPQ